MDPDRGSQENRPQQREGEGPLSERNPEPCSGEGAASAMARLQRQERNRLGREAQAPVGARELPG